MGDLDALLELYLYLHEEEKPVADAHLKDTWEKIINDPNHHLIVNEIDGKIVSSCVCVIIPNLTRNVRPYAFVENVVTHADYRQRGYASALLQKAAEIAKERNCYKLFLETGSNRESTLNFYRQNGFAIDEKHSCLMRL